MLYTYIQHQDLLSLPTRRSSDLQEKLVMDLGNAEEGIFTDMDEDSLYFVSSDRTKVSSVSLENLTSETLFEGVDISLAPKVGDGLLYSENNIRSEERRVGRDGRMW